ncbi:MAG: 30S ribosomal protein S6 [Phycisphaeraceae bacterium]|nr:30S ribosomal protein S6 [Phycisphaeraceae bacterium]
MNAEATAQTPVVKHLYEGLFLLAQGAASDLNMATEHLNQIFERSQCEVVVLRKWDERRLAYSIKGQKRGVYFLAYFNAPPRQIANLERDVNLSEHLLRCMILRAEHIGEVELEMAKRGERTWELEQKLKDQAAAESSEAAKSSDAPDAQKAAEAAASGSDDDQGQTKDEN